MPETTDTTDYTKKQFDELRANFLTAFDITTDLPSDLFQEAEHDVLFALVYSLRNHEESHLEYYKASPAFYNSFVRLVKDVDIIRSKRSHNITHEYIISRCRELSLLLYEFILRYAPNDLSPRTPNAIDYLPNSLRNKSTWVNEEITLYSRWLRTPLTLISDANKTASATVEDGKSLLSKVTKQSGELDKEFQIKISTFQKILDASVDKMSSSYKKFVWSKRVEKWMVAILACLVASLMIAFASIGIESKALYNILKEIPTWLPLTGGENTTATTYKALAKGFPLLVIEAFLLYFFRILLNNYYAARDELLQLQMRKALCEFVPQFKEFASNTTATGSNNNKETTNAASESNSELQQQESNASYNLDEFAKHIFSPLNSRMNPAPHPLDFFGQVTEAVKKAKK